MRIIKHSLLYAVFLWWQSTFLLCAPEQSPDYYLVYHPGYTEIINNANSTTQLDCYDSSRYISNIRVMFHNSVVRQYLNSQQYINDCIEYERLEREKNIQKEQEQQRVKEQKRQQEQQEKWQHWQQYGVSKDMHDILYDTRDFNKVALDIIALIRLTRQQALNLWQGYCDKRFVGEDKKLQVELKFKMYMMSVKRNKR